MQMHTPTLFVCDNDTAFINALSKQAVGLEVISTTSQADAQQRIADPSKRYSVIALNASMCQPYAIPLIRFCKMHRPATPICLLGDSAASLPAKEEMEAIHVQQAVLKPIDPSDLIQSLFPAAIFDPQKALALGSENKPGEETEVEDSGMHAIAAESFLCGKKSFFDVYVMLHANKYVMILKAGDDFDFERVSSYLKKGVKYFYLRKEAQRYFLHYCDKLTEALLKSDKVEIKAKQNQVQNFGRETLEFLKKSGVSEVTLASASRFGNFAHSLVKQLDPQNAAIKEFLGNLQACEHGTGTSLILALMLDALNYRDEKVLNVVAMGGFLHDIALGWLPEGIKEYDLEKLTPEQMNEYHKHPAQGAEILKNVRHINPLLPQVVLQHHERRDRKGFPSKLGPGQISPISEMIGIAESFHLLTQKKLVMPEFDPLKEMRLHHYDRFSLNIVTGFKKALGIKE